MKFLRAKSEALEKFHEFKAEQGIPKVLRSDNGKEFTSKHFERYCLKKTKQEVKVPPERNGTAEKSNRTIVEMARCLLLQAKSPKTYWLGAIPAACYFRNRVITNKESKSPFEKIAGKKPEIEKLSKFGWAVFVRPKTQKIPQ